MRACVRTELMMQNAETHSCRRAVARGAARRGGLKEKSVYSTRSCAVMSGDEGRVRECAPLRRYPFRDAHCSNAFTILIVIEAFNAR